MVGEVVPPILSTEDVARMIRTVYPDSQREWENQDRIIASHEALRAENLRLNRRLYPGQGEEYVNEVERQRYVIGELTRIATECEARMTRLEDQVRILDEAHDYERRRVAKFREALVRLSRWNEPSDVFFGVRAFAQETLDGR